MTEVLPRVLAFAFVVVAIVVTAVIARKIMGRPGLSGLLSSRPQRRIDIVEQAPIDNKHRLVLVRRDDVEHLILIGGPADIVVESGIVARSPDAETKSTAARRSHQIGVAAE